MLSFQSSFPGSCLGTHCSAGSCLAKCGKSLACSCRPTVAKETELRNRMVAI